MTSQDGGAFSYRALIGASLLLLPVGIHVYWSNMSVYTMSYIYRDLGPDTSFHFSWIISLSLFSRTGAFFIIDSAAKAIGPRNIALCGVVLFNVGMLSSYFSVQMSSAMLDVTVGGVGSVGGALLNGVVLKCVLPKCKSSLGFVTAVVQSSYAIGAIVIMQAMTMYINPRNQAPDKKLKHDIEVFSQNSILSKVPSAFLILGFGTLVIQTIGFILFRSIFSSNSKSEEFVVLKNGNAATEKPTESENSSTTSNGSSVDANTKIDDAINNTYQRDWEIKEMLTSHSFYVLWIVRLTSQYAFLIVSYNYKVYGLTYIKDDHLMANLGTFMAISSIAMRLFNGALLDKAGVKTDLVIVHATFALASQFVYTSIRLNKWFYCLAVAMLNGASSSQMSVYTVTTLKTFGKSYFMLKLALVGSPSLIAVIATPPILEATIFHWGWFVLFTQGAVLMAMNSAIIAFLFPFVR